MEEMLIKRAFDLEGKLVYKKLKDRYRIFCMKCRRYEYVSKEQFRQIQASRICPMCYREVMMSKTLEHTIHKYIVDEECNGYLVHVRFRFGCRPKTSITEVLHYLGGETIETRYIFRNMGFSIAFNPERDRWKVRKNAASAYMWLFYDPMPSEREISGKKEYIYTALFNRGITNREADEMVKSNQRKIFQDNLLNGRQMEYVIAFDLKSYEEVYRYRVYMRKNQADVKRVLNVYYLDYLCRNGIPLRDFYDYMDQCQMLGFRLDKPKDFQHRHEVLSELVAQKRIAEDEKNAKKRYASLLKKAYTDGNIRILPFRDGDEIRKCQKKLHNCIGGFVHRYAVGKTDLYYMTRNGKTVVAIEVCNRKLIQARSDHNHDCPKNLMKHIRKWCSMNKITIGASLYEE